MAQIKHFAKPDRDVSQDVANIIRKFEVVQINVQFVTDWPLRQLRFYTPTVPNILT